MMSGMFVIWLIFIIVVVSKRRNSGPVTRVWTTPLPPEQPQTPEEIARERFARGEIGWPEYQEVLVNLLKDRYVRGELELDEYEQRATLVLDSRLPGNEGAGEQVLPPASAEAPQPASLDAAAPARPTEPLDRAPATTESATATTAPAPDATAESEPRREARADSALDALRRRFLSGQLSAQEYEEERKRLLAA